MSFLTHWRPSVSGCTLSGHTQNSIIVVTGVTVTPLMFLLYHHPGPVRVIFQQTLWEHIQDWLRSCWSLGEVITRGLLISRTNSLRPQLPSWNDLLTPTYRPWNLAFPAVGQVVRRAQANLPFEPHPFPPWGCGHVLPLQEDVGSSECSGSPSALAATFKFLFSAPPKHLLVTWPKTVFHVQYSVSSDIPHELRGRPL